MGDQVVGDLEVFEPSTEVDGIVDLIPGSSVWPLGLALSQDSAGWSAVDWGIGIRLGKEDIGQCSVVRTFRKLLVEVVVSIGIGVLVEVGVGVSVGVLVEVGVGVSVLVVVVIGVGVGVSASSSKQIAEESTQAFRLGVCSRSSGCSLRIKLHVAVTEEL